VEIKEIKAKYNAHGQQIRIDINAQDIFTVPSKSYICITGQIIRSDNGNLYVMDNEITLKNNGMMYLFSLMKYEIGSATMESINYHGQVISMLGYATYPDVQRILIIFQQVLD